MQELTPKSLFSRMLFCAVISLALFSPTNGKGNGKNPSNSNRHFRIEKDTLGEVAVPKDALWGAQTQRSLTNFNIGLQSSASAYKMPREVIQAFFAQKLACVRANREVLSEKFTHILPAGIEAAAVKVLLEEFNTDSESDVITHSFPLSVFQTGSGTHTNMNVNEVLAKLANLEISKQGSSLQVHPNDHVNFS